VIHLDGSKTEGRFALLETRSPPGHMPPLHVHHTSDQAWFVLEGELTVHLPGFSKSYARGEVAYGPRGVPHTHPVTSAQPARVLEVTSPAGFEEFLREVGEPTDDLVPPPAKDAPLDVSALTKIAGPHGIELLGPPGALP
jgi:mannose-6-phosphate isomerase-like protein (cupin superfamily)